MGKFPPPLGSGGDVSPEAIEWSWGRNWSKLDASPSGLCDQRVAWQPCHIHSSTCASRHLGVLGQREGDASGQSLLLASPPPLVGAAKKTFAELPGKLAGSPGALRISCLAGRRTLALLTTAHCHCRNWGMPQCFPAPAPCPSSPHLGPPTAVAVDLISHPHFWALGSA